MLFKSRFLTGLRDGTITLTFRRWRRPQVRPGGRYRTPAGVLQVDDVREVEASAIGVREAKQAGYADRVELLRELERSSGSLYRVRFHFAGADPRTSLRERSAIAADEWTVLAEKLARLDQRRPWTRRVLALIAARPGVRAGDLASEVGYQRVAFKIDVRKLKELGLTESLEVGYRLSPRGHAVLRRLGRSA